MATPFTTYKLIILYMLSHTETTLTNSQISEFILDHDYTNYFNLQQAISELVDTGLVDCHTMGSSSHYKVTEEGRQTLSYFENELDGEIRGEVMDYLVQNGKTEPERLLTPADYYKTPQGRYEIRCQIIDNGLSLLDITLPVPGEEAAREMCRSWQKKSQNIYETIMEELL